MSRCPSCNSEFSKGAKFCGNCGADLGKSQLVNPVCPKCGKKYPAGLSRCDVDGAELVEEVMTLPRCVNCRREFTDGTKFCPDDGGMVIPDVLRKKESSPFEMGRKLEEGEISALTEKEHEINIIDYIKRGWEIFREDPGGFMGFAAVVIIFNVVLRFIPVLGFVIRMAVLAPLMGGFYFVAFKLIKKQKTDLSDFMRGFGFFLPLLLAGLLIGLLTALGLVLLIVPGVYLAVCYLFTFPFIVDRELDFWQAMEASRKLIAKNWFSFFNLSLLLLVINMGGALLFMVGLLFTVPLSFCTLAVAYEEVVGIETAYF